jgi:hypothetical protein
LPLIESMMTRLDDLTAKVSNLHHGKHPLGGRDSSTDGPSA